MRLTVTDIAKLVSGDAVGDGNAFISGFAGIKEAQEGDLTFLVNPKNEALLTQTKSLVVIVPRQMSCPGKTVIRVDNPSYAFTQVVKFLLKDAPDYKPQGLHPTAIISDQARLGKNVGLGPYVVVEPGAVIGDNTFIYAGCYVGHGVTIGADCLLYPNVSVRERVVIGSRVIVHNGTVIGSDGYGYVTVDGKHVKIPQVGTVVIEDDVEIGANVTIDRARFDKTVIGEGTKIDNLVQIAHNVVIGKHCLIVSQVGISGSSKLGNYVILAGQAGVAGHLEIGDGAVVAAKSGISKSIKAGEQIFGYPGQPMREAFKTNAHIQRLDHYVQMIKDLKKRVEELENKKI